VTLFVLWNLGTLVGALATQVLPDPKALGLDAAPPAAFLALVAPRLRGREPIAVALAAALVVLVLLPFVPPGVPLLVVAVLVVAFGLRPGR
jgi:predicted branched-subunit amino acid permease